MRKNTRLLFKTLLRLCKVDCVCDVGSCDGGDALKFRQFLPKATVMAFEANPLLYQRMVANQSLRDGRVEVFPYAVSSANGTAVFHVTDTDYDDPREPLKGSSSLLVYKGLKTKEPIEVKTCRLDEFIPSRHAEVQRVGLWIDAEGAEYGVIEGIAGIKTRVMTLHVETALTPQWEGQKVYSEVESLLKSYGFVPLAHNLTKISSWGDVVFVNEKAAADLGFRLTLWRWLISLLAWSRLDTIPSFLIQHCRPLYRLLWFLYTKLPT
jgi:FkbM family methyltransferase